MADRSVQIDLVARVQGFVAGINTARAATRGLVTDLEKSAKKQQSLRELGNAAGIMGLAATAAFVGIVKSAADFDQAMSNVQASTHETSANMDLLREAALKAGQETVFSATESAGAIESLAKAGVSTQDILAGGLTGALNLAAAGNLEVGDAAEFAASAMTQFGLSGAEVPHIADLLAAAAGKAQGEVSDMGAALNQVGLVANQTGLTIEETTGGLAAFASAGLTGSDAGTSFKTMLQSLTPRSKEAATLMKDLNLSAYDGQGNFIGLTKYAGRLQDALAGMSEQQQAATLKTIFGSDAVRAASVLYKQGADGIQGWIDKTNDAGYAAETAATRMDNLKGDLEQLRGALETAFIGTGSDAQGPLRELVQLVTGLVNAYNGLPGPVKTGALALAGLTGVIGLGTFAASRMIGAYVDLRTNMRTLGMSSKTAEGQVSAMSGKMIAGRAAALGLGIGLLVLSSKIDDSNQDLKNLTSLAGMVATGFAVGGPWGAAIGGAGGLLQIFTQESARAAQKQAALAQVGQSVASTLNQQNGALTAATDAAARKALADSDVYDAASSMGLSLETVTQASLGNKSALDQVTAAANAYVDANSGSMDQQLKAAAVADLVTGVVGAQADAIDNQRHSIDQQGAAAAESGDKTAGMGDKMGDAASQAKKLTSAILQLDSAMLNQRGTARDYRSAVLDARDALKENGKGLDMNTRKGIENNAMLDGIASAALAAATAENKHGRVVVTNRRLLEEARGTLIAMAQSFGMTAPEARKYANEVLRIPKSANTNVNMNTSGALAQLSTVQRYLAGLHDKTITVNVNTGAIGHIATGGTVHGPAGIDKVPAMLTDGEEVIREPMARKHRALLKMINAGYFANGGTVGHYAQGGTVHGSTMSLGDLLSMLTRPEIYMTLNRVNDAFRAMRTQARQVNDAEQDLHNTRERSRNQTHMLGLAERRLEQAQNRKKVDTAEVARLEDHLAHRRYVSKQADKDLERAEKDLSKQRDQLSAATDRWKAKQQELIDQAKAIAATVVSQGAAFGGAGTSVTAQGLLAKKQTAKANAKAFFDDLQQLRKMHYSRAGLLELLEQGPTPEGMALADSLAHASRSLLRDIGAEYRGLDRQGARVGTFGTNRVPIHPHHRGHHHRDGKMAGDTYYQFTGPVSGEPRKYAREVERERRRATTRARQIA